MASVNKVLLLGNLTRDAVLKQSDAGTVYARFGLAVNTRRKGGEEDVLFIEATAFGPAADVVGELGKGSSVFLEGRLQLNQWEGRDGQSRRGFGLWRIGLRCCPRNHGLRPSGSRSGSRRA